MIQPSYSDITGMATDVAGNTATAKVTVKVDKTAPTMGVPVWSVNPLPVGINATVLVPATDVASGLAKAEYFVGTTDPGQGNGTALTMANEQRTSAGEVTSAELTASFGANLLPGVYQISMRTQDAVGNWSAVTTDYLTVFNPAGPKDVAASKRVVPSLADGDVLPGLIDTKQNGQANVGFDVFYTTTGTVDTASKLSFDYLSEQRCNSPNATGCTVVNFTATSAAPNSINWLVIGGQTGSEGSFQGVGTLTVNGVTTTNPFKVVATDGDRTTPTTTDGAILYLYAPGSDPASAVPLYQLHVVTNGNWVKIL